MVQRRLRRSGAQCARQKKSPAASNSLGLFSGQYSQARFCLLARARIVVGSRREEVPEDAHCLCQRRTFFASCREHTLVPFSSSASPSLSCRGRRFSAPSRSYYTHLLLLPSFRRPRRVSSRSAMPRAFLITNRRYNFSPPPLKEQDDSSSCSTAALHASYLPGLPLKGYSAAKPGK